MNVIAYDPYQHEDIFEELDVECIDLDGLLADKDYVSARTPLTGETYHMLSAAEFVAMKDDTIAVNTARGPIIDEQALLDTVEADELWARDLTCSRQSSRKIRQPSNQTEWSRPTPRRYI